MKNKDIKYIIKRVIIGVLIVLIVGSINKCNVKAESITYYFEYNSLRTDHAQSNWYLLDEIQFQDLSNTYTIKMYINPDDSFYKWMKYMKYYDSTTDTYFYNRFYTGGSDYDSVKFNIDSNNQLLNNNISFCTGENPCRNHSFNSGLNNVLAFSLNSLTNLSNAIYYPNAFNNKLSSTGNINWLSFGGLSFSYFVNSSLYPSYELSSVFPGLSVYINNIEQDVPIVPSYYHEINLQDYPGVYFVPKNYSTVPTTQNSINETVIPFNYYYKGNFAEGYFPLNNYKQIVFLPNSLLSREEISFSSIWFPLKQVIDDTTYDYYAYIFENNDYATFSQHEDSLIYYDSRYFDYYLIDDFYDYHQPIDIINKENQQEQINVSITTSLNSLFKAGSQTQGTKYIGESISDSLQDVQIIKYLDFIKIPLDFLNNIMTSSTCSPIEIPIPFTGGNLTLPCISSLFNEKIPQIYTILVIVVNGLLVYRITIRNIDTLTDSLSSDDDKLEVVDL